MGWPGPRRPIVGVRLSEDDIDYIDRWAKAWGVGRSEAIRRMLSEWAKRHGEPPKGAKPD